MVFIRLLSGLQVLYIDFFGLPFHNLSKAEGLLHVELIINKLEIDKTLYSLLKCIPSKTNLKPAHGH
jgi:hypothetical protein